MATAPTQSVALDVDDIRPGLYVRALDRPWIETPFVFQGFRIVGDAEIEALRSYCRTVYIDLGRSDPGVAEALATRTESNAGESGADAGDATVGEAAASAAIPDSPLFIDAPYPDRELFRPRVRIAAQQRARVQRALKDAMTRARGHQAVDIPGAQTAVAELARLISDDPTASLWLAQMRAHDDYTTTHSVNACVLALAFGRYLGLEGEELQHLGLGVLLMDIGRTTLPNDLFAKQRGLSATEWAMVQRHVVNGVRLLSRGDVPEPVLDIVRMHHERVRGNGYPKGISGDRVPWPALIAGLVDSYDAMVRQRPHRGPYTPVDALNRLYDQAPATFGQDLVESFIRYMGTYPVGSLVELDNDTIGVVVGNRPGSGLWPTVLLLRDADRRPFEKRVLLNLAAANQSSTEVASRSVRRPLTQREAKVAVGKVAAVEFGMGESA